MNELINTFYRKYHNFFLYCAIGCVGASLDFCIFAFLTITVGLYHLTANAISISVGIVTNFFLNYFLNFKNKGKLWLRLLSFYLIGLLGLGLSSLLLWFFIDHLGMSAVASKLGTIIFVTVLQYTLNKAISFRKRKK